MISGRVGGLSCVIISSDLGEMRCPAVPVLDVPTVIGEKITPETAHHRREETSERPPAEVFFLAAVASSINVLADGNFPVWQASKHITSHLTV